MLKFEINRMTIELIRAILRFRSSFLAPMSKENNIQIYVSRHDSHEGVWPSPYATGSYFLRQALSSHPLCYVLLYDRTD